MASSTASGVNAATENGLDGACGGIMGNGLMVNTVGAYNGGIWLSIIAALRKSISIIITSGWTAPSLEEQKIKRNKEEIKANTLDRGAPLILPWFELLSEVPDLHNSLIITTPFSAFPHFNPKYNSTPIKQPSLGKWIVPLNKGKNNRKALIGTLITGHLTVDVRANCFCSSLMCRQIHTPCHAWERVLSNQMNNDRADGLCYSFAWI